MSEYDDKLESYSRLYDYDDEHELERSRRPAPGRLPATARLMPSVLQVILRDAVGGRMAPTAAAQVEIAASSTGDALPNELRTRLESSLDTDLRSVRIHTGTSAAAAARALAANAYTVGQDIYFGDGKYDPASATGQRLIAHEVAHTVQQRGASAPSAQTDLEVSSPGDAHETEAENFAQAFVHGERASVAPVSRGVVSRQVIHRDGSLDYQNHIQGSGARAADQHGVAAAARTKNGLLPNLNIPLDHAASRQAYFREQMYQHLQTGMSGVNPKNLKHTHAYTTMKDQLDGYLDDVPALTSANTAYNAFVPSANLATRGLAKHRALQQRLAFDDNTNFEHELTGPQREALRKAQIKEPLNQTKSVKLAEGRVKGARETLFGHIEEMAAVTTATAMKEVQKKIDKNQKGIDAINNRIKRVAKIAETIQQAASLATAGTNIMGIPGAVSSAMTSPGNPSMRKAINTGAGHVKTYTGYAGSAVSAAMQLYYENELREFENKITIAKGELSQLEARHAVQVLQARMQQFRGAKSTFKNAIDAYDAAINDRRVAMARLGAAADKSLVGEKGMKKGEDNVSQTMLYMTSVRENRSLVSNAMAAGSHATTKINEAHTQLGHRRKSYQTNKESWSTQGRVEDFMNAPDAKVLREMTQNTRGWMNKAQAEKKLLDKQDASAARVMRGAGYGGEY